MGKIMEALPVYLVEDGWLLLKVSLTFLCYMFNEKSSKASEESLQSLMTRRLIYGEILLHDWAIQPRGPQLSGKLLSNDISEDDRRYWTNELYWGMGLWRGGGSGVTSLAY